MRHEIVHNTYVVNDLKAKGAIFIEDLAEVPPGATLVFSAHGVSRKACATRRPRRGFSIFDATCPLVTKVHVGAPSCREGYDFIMIGPPGHPEVEGTMGQLDGRHLPRRPSRRRAARAAQTERLAVVTQTTLSVDDAREIRRGEVRFPGRAEPQRDICYATQNRQDA